MLVYIVRTNNANRAVFQAEDLEKVTKEQGFRNIYDLETLPYIKEVEEFWISESEERDRTWEALRTLG